MDFITIINAEWNFASWIFWQANQWQSVATGQPQWGALGRTGKQSFPNPADIILQPGAHNLISLIWTCMLFVSRAAWMQKSPWWLPICWIPLSLRLWGGISDTCSKLLKQCEERFLSLNLNTLTWHDPFSVQTFFGWDNSWFSVFHQVY